MPVSVALTPGLVLNAATLKGRDLSLQGPVSGRLDSLALSLAPVPGSAPDAVANGLARAVALDLDGLALGDLDRLRLSLRAVLHMSEPPRPTTRPLVQKIDLSQARMEMGNIRAEAIGTLTRGPDGRLSGSLPLTVTNWRVLLSLLQQAGVLPPDQAPMVMMMAQSLSTGDTLSLPLTVADSVLYLGPLALFDLGPV